MSQFSITNGSAFYIYYLSDFSSQNVPFLELKFPSNYPVYLIPEGVDYHTLVSNGTISQYQMTSILEPSQTNNTSVYGILNSNFSRFLHPVAYYGKPNVNSLSVINNGTLNSPSFNQSLSFINKSKGLTETIIVGDSNANTAIITPTPTTVPYILINGSPLISLQNYLTSFTQLKSYNFSYSQSQITTSIVTQATTNNWLTTDQINQITQLYNQVLSDVGSGSGDDENQIEVGAQVASIQSLIYRLVDENATSSSSAYIDAATTQVTINENNINDTGGNEDLYSIPFMYYDTGDAYNQPNISCTAQALSRSEGSTNFVYQFVQGGWNWNNWVQNLGNFSPNVQVFKVINGLNANNVTFSIPWCFPMLNTISTPQSNVPWPYNNNGYVCEVWTVNNNQSFPGSLQSSTIPDSDYCSTNVSWNYTLPDTVTLNVGSDNSLLYNSSTNGWFYLPYFSFTTPLTPSVWYNFITDGTGAGGRMYIGFQGLFLSWNMFNLAQKFGSLQRNKVTASVTIPVVNLNIVPISTKYNTSDDADDFTKLSEGYYSAGNMMVSAYYNALLAKAKYIVNEQNQQGTPTALQYILGLALKFDFMKPLLSEWVNGHPFKYVPKVTSQLLFNINSSLPDSSKLSDAQVLESITTFFTTVVPNSQNAHQLDSSTQTDQTSAAVAFAKVSNEDVTNLVDFTTVPTLVPSVFRMCIKKVFAMGAFLNISHGYLSILKLHQAALQKNWTVSSSDQAGCLPPDTDTSMTAMFTSQNHASFDKAKFDMEDHVSGDMHPLIYPLFDDVMEDIHSDIDGIRYLTEGRLHGMSYDLYQPELKSLFSKRIRITHEFIHLFTKSLHVVGDFVSDIINASSWIDRKLGAPLNTLVLKPITYIAVGIAKFAASALLDMTSLVSPGSEILTIAEDANIMRPLPYPLSPFGTTSNKPFKNRILNGSVSDNGIDPASIECFVPYIGLTTREAANHAKVYYDAKSNTYSLLLTPRNYVESVNAKTGEVTWVAPTGSSYGLRINSVTPGLHCIRLLTSAGSVRMWYSANMNLASDGSSFQVNPNVQIDGITSDNAYLTDDGFICFVPDMVVNLDERISLPKSIKKWALCSIALKGLFTAGPQTSQYIKAVNQLSAIPGFNNVKSHISIGAFAAACTADVAAYAASMGSAISTIISTENWKAGAEDVAMGVEDLLNVGRCTTIYDDASGVNVMNAFANQGFDINRIINMAWDYSQDDAAATSQYSLQYYNMFSDTLIDQPDFNTPQWYPESWGRLFGDIMLGVAKIAFFLHAQHKVFKKWSNNNTEQQQQKVSLMGILKNKIHNKWNNHKIVKGVDGSISKMNHSFMSDPNLDGLRNYELSSNKSIKSILSDDTSLTSLVKSLQGSPGARGIN